MSGEEIIRVLIVDDIPDTRENLRKLLAFESDIEVVGGSGAGTGREAIELAIKHKPDVVLMDINMPDMDGITATKGISEKVRTAAVVIMSVQSEPGYLRQAMLAGARDFLTKPVSSDELYQTIRRVYDRNAPIRQQMAQMSAMPAANTARAAVADIRQEVGLSAAGAGHVIVVYSPQAGAGVTTIATNLASALMSQDTRVLLMDCNLQFGDVDTFLNLQAQSNISDLTKVVSDVDQEMLNSVLVTHGSGLKVLVAPPHPEQAYDIAPEDVKELINLVAGSYDFVIVDMPTLYDDLTLKLFDVAERILLVATPTIPAIRNTRKILDILEYMEEPADLKEKVLFVLNRVVGERDKGRGTVPTASIVNALKQPVLAEIPLGERAILTAVNQGVPLVAKDTKNSPGRDLLNLALALRREVEGLSADEVENTTEQGRSGLRALFG
ncbi:MAG: response regulator [Anaerolineae bacterium]|nr:response regulator [Anaerolineae bacterium]